MHGIGHQLQELSALRAIPITNSDGTGATDAATLDLAIRASSRVSHLILEGLTQSSLKAAITNAVRAVPVGIIKGVDQQLTGKVDRIDKELIVALIERQVVPLVSPARVRPGRQVAAGQFRPPRRRDGRGPPRDEDHLPGAEPRA